MPEPIDETPAINAENGGIRQNRLSNGQFAPGSIHNPGGRPKTRYISEALRDALANGEASELAQEAIRLAKRSKYDSVRLAAISEIADRTEGKAIQSHKVEASISADVARSLAELAAKFLPIAVGAPVIDGSIRPLLEPVEEEDNEH